MTIAALLCVSVIGILLFSDVAGSGVWDGEPSRHILMSMHAVNRFVAEWGSGGNPLKAFLQCFGPYPKQIHDGMLALFILAANGPSPVDFSTVEQYALWFVTLWTLVGIVALYLMLRRYVDESTAMIALPLAALSTYIVLYANHPRHNMPAHAIVWLATAIYVIHRVARDRVGWRLAVVIGLLFGAAVPTHYSSVYWFFGFAACELCLQCYDRHFKQAWVTFAIVLGTAALVWMAIDLYFYLFSAWYPEESNFEGKTFYRRPFGFLEGMLHTAGRLAGEVAAFKLETTKWWFLAGLLYRDLGPVGLLLIAIGMGASILELKRLSFSANQQRARSLLIIHVLALVCLLVSLGYFQNARKLMPFFPAWAAFLALGLATVSVSFAAAIEKAIRGRGDAGLKATARYGGALLAYAAVISAQALTFYPEVEKAYRYIRDTGYMRRYLAEHSIKEVMVLPYVQESTLAPAQVAIQTLSVSEADRYEYIVLNRLYKNLHGEALVKCIRPITPIVAFTNQAALPIFWYEFPLKKSFLDPDDSVVVSRSLYRWRDLKNECLSHFLGRGFVKP